jgi:hemolysin activation/secretion protein
VFTGTAAGHIRINDAGYYLISYSIPINDDNTTIEADRTRVFTVMETASNSAFTTNLATVDQSRAQVYTREASGGSGLSTTFLYEHTAGQYIRIRIDAQNNTNISTESNQSQISIVKVPT